MSQDELIAVAGSIEGSHLLPILQTENEPAPYVGFLNLPIELFPTDDAFYVFDARKVVFIEVAGDVFAILAQLRDRALDVDGLKAVLPDLSEEDIREALAEVERLQNLGYLVPSAFERRSYARKDFEQTLSRRLAGFTVHVTTQCNLGCSYCIYSGDYERHEKLSQTAMPWETARNMVDFLIQCSRESESVRLDFFGGEPLVAFDLLRRTVEYAKERLGTDGPPLSVTIASNGTILTDAILDFLVRHQVYLQFSIDGSKNIHDRERTFLNGRGSYDLILRNLQRIYDHDADYFREYIRIKSVITMQSLEDEDDGFFEHPLIRIAAENDHLSTLVKEPHYDVAQDGEYFQALSKLGDKLLERSGIATLNELLEPLTFRQKEFFRSTFGAFMDVQAINALYFKNPGTLRFTKGCLMGYQEGAVQPNGNIAICHKSTSFVIGNVHQKTWDFDRIWQLQTNLYEGWPGCSTCFASRFCNLCHEKLDGQPGQTNASRSRFCNFNRESHRVIFDWMLRILDRNPKLWEDFEAVIREQIKQKKSIASSSLEIVILFVGFTLYALSEKELSSIQGNFKSANPNGQESRDWSPPRRHGRRRRLEA